MGKIAANLNTSHEQTPLQKQLDTFSKQITWVVIFVILIVFILGVIT